MTILTKVISSIVVVIYLAVTTAFILDWRHLSVNTELSEVALLMHVLFSGGAVSAYFAIYAAIKNRLSGALTSGVLLPLEILLSFISVIAGFGEWLALKFLLITSLTLLARTWALPRLPRSQVDVL